MYSFIYFYYHLIIITLLILYYCYYYYYYYYYHYYYQMYFGTAFLVWAPKKMCTKCFCSFFSYIFHVKTKWNIVYQYLKTKTFSRDKNIFLQIHWISNLFEHSPTTIGGFGVSLEYPILNFKKTVCPKNVWMQHRLFCIRWQKDLDWLLY